MSKKFLLDALERVVATFVEVFAGALIAGPTINIGTVQAAALAGLIAALTVVKTVAASFVGDKDSAGVVRARKRTP